MPHIRQRFSGTYTLTATAYDVDAVDAPVVEPVSVVAYDPAGFEVASGIPALESGVMVFRPSVEDLPLVGRRTAYRVEFSGRVGGIDHVWRVHYEVVPHYWPDHTDYAAAGGRLPAARFDELLPHAIAEVDAAIWPNAVTDATALAWVRAVCAVADVLDEPAVTSEHVGNASVTYADPRTIAAVIRQHLTGTGLLYRGI